MSDNNPEPVASPPTSAPRRFSRRRLLAFAGTALGALALGARPSWADGDHPAPGRSRGNGLSPASAAGQGPRQRCTWKAPYFVAQKLTPKQSAYWYRDVISRNGLR
jgi:hypothetical protein